ncbi:YfcE family phosphodiesterase [Thalassoglobus sp. JC818]|uniref:metallophosphoesterase family protein n=1 Tax=Thalassoglobus sp. JC818 TaxID=3232136 RepID=UPI003457C4F2
MRIGIVSDTHGNLENTSLAVEHLRSHEIENVIHCGDIGSASIPSEFTEFQTHFVFGNVDSDVATLRQAINDANGTCHGRFGEVTLGGRKIAFLHGDDAARANQTIESNEYDLVCYGHTHKAESHQEGSTLVLNPGALHRANPHTLAIVDLTDLSVQHLPLRPEPGATK